MIAATMKKQGTLTMET